MFPEVIAISALIVILFAWWVREYKIHNKYLSSIPTRIHINGSRGKSSVTRLIGGAIREAGFKTVTKTTGTNARFIFPDGHEEPIIRIGPANIREQLWVVRKAAQLGAEVLVTECMAVDPEFQWVVQHDYIKGTIGVITNVRADHLDVMGPDVPDVADALSSVMQPGGVCFTAEQIWFDRIKQNADKIGCRLFQSAPATISDEEMAKFTYIEHKENVALALAVAKYLGVDRDVALRGMWKANPDPGVLRIFNVESAGKKIRFANAFAANDPDSTSAIWNMFQSRIGRDETKIILSNSRTDRIQRAQQLGNLMGKQLVADYYILVGAFLQAISAKMEENGVTPEQIVRIPDGDPKKVFDAVLSLTPQKSFVIGIGNIGGAGHAIEAFFEAHAVKSDN